jgi:hypothetical protein
MSPELAGILADIVGPGQRFGHRQHIQLAFIAAKQDADAADLMRDWIRQIAAAHGVPDKYHETLTVAWARIVAHHATADIADFNDLVGRYPALLDKTLLTRHYSPAVLNSAAARTDWLAPDLLPLP